MQHRTLVIAFILWPAVGRAQTALTLDAAIRRALETHPSIGAALERVRAARGSRLTARSWSNPVLTYQVDHAPLRSTQPVLAGAEQETSLSLTLPLEPSYQLWSRSARASADVRRAEADLLDARRLTVLDVAQAFHRAAAARVAVQSGENVRAWLDSLVDYTRKRAREGAAAEVDLIRLEVEQGSVETDLALSRVELTRAETDLASMVGLDSVTAEISRDSQPSQVDLPPLARLIALARQNRPDLRSAEASIQAANAGVSLERASIVRDVGATAGIMTMEGSRTLMAGISMPLPFLDQNRGEIQRATAERRAAAFDRLLVERHVTAEVTSAYAATRSLGAQVARISADLLRRAEEGRRIAEGAYREGAVPLVQVLDAARAFADARTLYYRALFAFRQSVIELNSATGSNDLMRLDVRGDR